MLGQWTWAVDIIRKMFPSMLGQGTWASIGHLATAAIEQGKAAVTNEETSQWQLEHKCYTKIELHSLPGLEQAGTFTEPAASTIVMEDSSKAIEDSYVEDVYTTWLLANEESQESFKNSPKRATPCNKFQKVVADEILERNRLKRHSSRHSAMF
ncbi:MAG: hypothetical protein Q9200_001435 [Gallowayella weberi]